jgi:predicted aspartyl protease
MGYHSHRSILGIVLIALAATSTWAAFRKEAAHLFLAPQFQRRATADSHALAHAHRQGARRESVSGALVPAVVRFRDVDGQGLMTRVWINGVGEFNFVIDTGAGATLLSEQVAREAQVALKGSRVALGGLSGSGMASGREAVLRRLAVGESDNFLPARGLCIVTDRLPPGVDGVLDPTEAYWPLGYTIDLPHNELSAFDPRTTPLRRDDAPPGGTVVSWIFAAGSRRPFVMLNGARRALLDTGSDFGLALSAEEARIIGVIPAGGGRARDGVRDIGGGQVAARRIAPATVSIGSLVLRGVPTDLLVNAHAGAPILLGRDALQPFELTFDPLNRLIRIAPR